MRTRSARPAQSVPEQASKVLTTATKPSKTFILPSTASSDARFLTLPDPRTGSLTRYFFCPKLGVYEFTVVASPPQVPRSVLFELKSNEATTRSEGDSISTWGTVSKHAQLLVATPIDVMFFLISVLSPASKPGQTKALFQPLDDIIDSQDEMPKHLRYILYNDTFRNALLERVEAVCETVEAGDEKMFRFSEEKLLKELIAKAERMVAHGLPVSLEERFVRQALATPLMVVKREDSTANGAPANASDGDSESPEKSDTQSTTATTTSASTPSGQETPVMQPASEEPSTPENVVHLLRLSTALSFMKEAYLSQDFAARVDAMLASAQSPIDFKPLTDHLKHIAELRAEALAARAVTDFSRKRALDDEEAAESRAERKRRKEEEEKKNKAGESRGVRELKKVNTSGMKKMSDFFSKAAPKKKS